MPAGRCADSRRSEGTMNPTSTLQQLATIERRLPSEWVLWEAIRDEVPTYFDQSHSPWSIDDEPLGSQGLALNFFFPMRADLRGLSRLFGVLCGRQIRVDAFELICRGRAATLALPFDIVAHLHDDEGAAVLLLLKCVETRATTTARDINACVLNGWPAAESVCDARLPILAHGQRLAADLERKCAADQAVFAVIHDNRDVSFADLCAFWRHTRAGSGRFHAWTYQQVLALAGPLTAEVSGWRTFLARRYGIYAIGSQEGHFRPSAVREGERRTA